ncbi:hypothetical protein RP20_CCG005265 [Aedes albopictus]|nr:hypothetical protein RP20_CCG005265 [Aedes albopictus]
MAISAATQEAIWWRGFREELSGCAEPVPIFCDNRSAVHLAEKEIGYSSRSKHIDIRHHFVRQYIEDKYINLEHVSAEYQAADMLTKALPTKNFEDGRKTLGIREILG